MGEVWRPVAGFEGAYEVSDLGRVRSLPGGRRHGRVLNPSPAGRGYLTVDLCVDGKVNRRYVHHLVAGAFVGVRPSGLDVCHDNGDMLDNRAANLGYDTVSANNRDAIRHGKHAEAKRSACDNGHPFTAENTQVIVGVSSDGGTKIRRRCKTCQSRSQAAYRARRRAAA